MPLPFVQPKHVQLVIGAKGETLTGPLVQSDKLGVTASITKEFAIGGEQGAPVQVARTESRLRQYRTLRDEIVALQKRLETARSKDWLRDDNNLENLGRWGEFAGGFRSDCDRLNDKLSALQLSDRMRFVDALSYVQSMFLAVVSNRPDDYEKFRDLYKSSLRYLDQHVIGTQSRQPLPPSVRSAGSPAAETMMRMAKALEKPNTQAALGYYRDVIEKYPNSPEAKQANDRIEALEKQVTSRNDVSAGGHGEED